MVEPSVSGDPPSSWVAEANAALKAAQGLPRGAERIEALIRAGVLRNRAVLTELTERRVK